VASGSLGAGRSEGAVAARSLGSGK
jgi:hypothetical protein